jgi:tetratricopeptide (TPR) repeat protein
VFKEATVIGHDKIREELIKNVKEDYYTRTFSDAIKHWEDQLKESKENSNQWKQYRIYLYEAPEILSTIADNFKAPVPDISFSDEMELDMGDVTFKMKYFGPAHTQSDILVYVPEEKLLFVGDLFNYPGDVNFHYFGKENSESWIKALDKILVPENEIEYVVNAHYSRIMSKNVLMGFYQNMQVFANGYKEGREPYNSENLIEIEEKSGLNGLQNEINKLTTTEKNQYFYFENTLNVAAYRLLGQNKLNEALEIFIFITKQFPESWNAFDSLGEAYMLAGNKELAIKNYEKSLELNPKNTNAMEQIKKLKTN